MPSTIKENKSKVSHLNGLIHSNDLQAIKLFLGENKNEIAEIAASCDEKGESAVTLSGTLGLCDVLSLLACSGISLDVYDGGGYKAIHRAAYHGHEPVVKYLADKGLCSCRTKNGFTALHISANLGHYDIVETLLLYVVDVDEPCWKGWTALHMASHRGHKHIVAALLNKVHNSLHHIVRI